MKELQHGELLDISGSWEKSTWAGITCFGALLGTAIIIGTTAPIGATAVNMAVGFGGGSLVGSCIGLSIF